MGQQLPRPTLHVSNTLVAQALDHVQALSKIYNEMRLREFNRLHAGLIKVTRLPYAGPNQMRQGRSKFADLLR